MIILTEKEADKLEEKYNVYIDNKTNQYNHQSYTATWGWNQIPDSWLEKIKDEPDEPVKEITLKIIKNEYDEYEVQYFENGIKNEEYTYYTASLEDAKQTKTAIENGAKFSPSLDNGRIKPKPIQNNDEPVTVQKKTPKADRNDYTIPCQEKEIIYSKCNTKAQFNQFCENGFWGDEHGFYQDTGINFDGLQGKWFAVVGSKVNLLEQ